DEAAAIHACEKARSNRLVTVVANIVCKKRFQPLSEILIKITGLVPFTPQTVGFGSMMIGLKRS
ncbi:MAG: hypothetical protein ACPG5W_08905, partial [Flavobacteriales bacterium]